MSEAKTIFVSGGLGYVGSVLCKTLLENKYKVVVYDKDIFQNAKLVETLKPLGNIKLIEGDILDEKKMETAMSGCDTVVHLAAIVGDPACLLSTQNAIQVNCVGTRRVVHAANTLGIDRFILASSCSIYGAEDALLTEQSNTFPVDFYGQTKEQQERIVHTLFGRKACVLRFSTIYGLSPRMRYDLVVNAFIAKSLHSEELTVYGGEQIRPFVHVQDVARAITHCIDRNLLGTYNIVSECDSILSIAQQIGDFTKSTVKVTKEILDKRNYRVSGDKLIKTGFNYLYVIRNAVKEIALSDTHKEYWKAKYYNHVWMRPKVEA